jgi:hypothetical protein
VARDSETGAGPDAMIRIATACGGSPEVLEAEAHTVWWCWTTGTMERGEQT